jgi:ATP-binding cassette subfamily F protein 3
MLLDEPTNHLDMSSQEVLQEAMAQYDGTIVVVSHNRYFVDSFVNRVIEVKDGRITLHEGNVAEYLVKQAELVEEREASTAAAARGEAAVDGDISFNRRERKKQEALLRQERSRRAGPWLQKAKVAEEQVEKLEAEKDELEAQMADPEMYRDEKAWTATSRAYEECKRRLERWYERWETAQGKVEEIDRDLCG